MDANSAHLLSGQFPPAIRKRSAQAQSNWMWTVGELRGSVCSTDFPFQFPSLGRANEGHSEICPKATCFGCMRWVAAMLKGELV